VRGGTYDQISYDALAQRVATGYGFTFASDWWPLARAGQPTAFWSYLYTLFLAGVYTLFGPHPLAARLIQAVLVGVLLPWLLYRIGRRTFGATVGLVAAGLAVVYLYFITYAATLMTESLYIVGILWTLDVAMRLAERLALPAPRVPWGLGLELGVAMAYTLLMRQVIVVFLGVVVLWLLWLAARRHAAGRALAALAIAGVVAFVLILPFSIRNYLVFGEVSMPNTNVGINFFWANHPIYGTHFEPVLSPEHGVSYQDLIPPEVRSLNEVAMDRALLARGVGFVVADPGRYVLLSLSRIPVYFLFWPTRASSLLSNVSRVLSFTITLPFMLWGLALAVRRLKRRHDTSAVLPAGVSPLWPAFIVLLLLFASTYTAIHLASWANVRYRLPVDAVLLIFAAYALTRLYVQTFKRSNVQRSNVQRST